MFQVTFDGLGSYDDLGLIYNTKTISEPSPKTNKIAIPGRNGDIDLSEVLTGAICYENRTITIKFTLTNLFAEWEKKRTELASKLHGKKIKIIFDDDVMYYWYGRVEVGAFSKVGSGVEVVITCDVEPYKYDIGAEWLWDPFNFDEDIITEATELEVDGTLTEKLTVRRQNSYPTITSTAAMTVAFKGVSYDLAVGVNKMYSILFDVGENTLTFTGNGTVTVDYLGGSL